MVFLIIHAVPETEEITLGRYSAVGVCVSQQVIDRKNELMSG